MASSSSSMNPDGFTIQLSPQRAPPPKAATKQRNKPDARHDFLNDENARNVLYNQLLKDPEKKRMVLQLLNANQDLIQKYMAKEKATAGSVNKVKNPVKFESPTALMKRRQLENSKKLQSAAARDAAQLEHRLTTLAVTPTRKPVKKTLLRDVYAFVEVMNANHVDKSEGVKQLLQKLGGNVVPKLTNSCTHVIYKDGTYDTFKKARQMKLPIVSLLWLDVMDRTGFRVPHDMYPALGDHKSKQACDEICEKLNSTDKRRTLNPSKTNPEANNSRRQTLLPSHTFQLDEEYLAGLRENEDSDDIIGSSQPESSSSRLDFSKRNQTLSLNTNEDNSDSNSGVSDAPSDEPLISGRPSRKTRDELKQSLFLSNTLLNSPYVNKAKRGRPRKTSTDEKENSVRTPVKSSLFKNITKRKTPARNIETPEIMPEVDISNDDSGNDTGNMSPSEASTSVATKPSRKTLLHPEELGIVNETDNNTFFMELTGGKSLSKTKNDETPKRATNNTVESMEITDIVKDVSTKDDDISKATNKESDSPNTTKLNSTPSLNKSRRKTTYTRKSSIDTKTKSISKNKPAVSTSTPKSLISATKTPKPLEEEELTKQVGNKSTRTSTSSTRTSASEDLLAITNRRVTRRMTMNAKLGNSGTEEMSPLQITDDNMSGSKKTSLGEICLNVSKRTVSSVPSLRISANTDELKNISTGSRNATSSDNVVTPMETDLPNTDVTKEQSNMTSSSGGPSLRLSTSTEGSKNSSINKQTNEKVDEIIQAETRKGDSSNKNTTDCSLNKNDSEMSSIPSMELCAQNDVIENTEEMCETSNVPESNGNDKKIVVSPVSNLSQQLSKATIGAQPAMNSNTFDTASTSYSIVDAAETTNEVSTRLGDSGPSKISNFTTTRSTVSGSSQSTTTKRKLCHPDDAVSEHGSDADEERRLHSLLTQERASMDTTRKALKVRLENLKIPDRIQEGPGAIDDDFWDPVALTQRTQKERMKEKLQTQTQKKNIKSIVCTRFHSAQIADFLRIVNELGEFKIEQDVTAKTTHLVAMEATRTLNILRAMSRGIWILRSDWLFESMEAGEWLDEECYEMTEFSPFVQELRLQRESFGKAFCHDVFVNCGPIYVAPNCHPSKNVLQDLIMLCKGKITNDLLEASIVIGNVDGEETDSQTCVREVWILDCITFGRCKKFKNYLHTA